MARLPCKDYLKGTCTNSFCERWHPPACLFYKSESGCRFGEKCSYAHRQVDEQPSKRSKKNGDKSAVAMLNITRQSGFVFQDMEPPKSSSILRKSSDMRKPIRCVKFTKAVVRHADVRDQNPSFGMICPGDPHQRSSNAPKFEDRSQEETEWARARCSRSSVEAGQKCLKNKGEKIKQHSSHLRRVGACLRHQPLKPEEREFVVDSGASMHMISKKDLSDGEMDTLTKSCSPNSQWWSADAWRGHSVCQRIGYVLDNESPRGYASSFIARKALRWTRIVLRVDQQSKTTSHLKRYSDTVQFGKLRTDRGSWFINEFFLKLALFNIHDTFKAGDWLIIQSLPQARPPHHPWHLQPWQAKVWIDKNGETRVGWITIPQSCQVNVWKGKNGATRTLLEPQKSNCWLSQPKIQKPNKNEDHDQEWRDPCHSDIPEWLQEFRENLVDDRVPEHRDTREFFSWIIFRAYEKCGFG